jgi:predicted RNA-binding protein with RPS1 domain
VGDEIQVKVLKFDKDKQRVSLGFKQLTPDPWLDADGALPGGRARSWTRAFGHRLRRVCRAGAGHRRPGSPLEMTWSKRLKHPSKLVKPAAEGIEGLCHNSEALDGNGQPMHLEPGSEHDFKIVKMNPEEKKVGLSIRAVGDEASRTEVEAYKHPAASTGGGSTIGDLLTWKRAGGESN